MENEYISFYELTKELAKEDGKEYYNFKNIDDDRKDEWENKFKNYKDTKIEYFKEIFGEKYKVGNRYKIPIGEKEIVKMAIRGYTTKYYNDVRNKRIPQFEDLIKYIEMMEEAIKKSNISEEKRKDYIAEIYGVLELESKKVSIDVYNKITELIKESIEEIKVKQIVVNGEIKNKIRDLNDYDAKLLIMYYEKLIIDVTRKWNTLCDTVSELRMEEILNNYEEQFEIDNDFVEFNKIAKKSINILKEAINIYNDDNEKNLPIEIKKLTIEEKQKLAKISELFKK